MKNLNNALFTSDDQTWETPQDLFDKLDNVFNFEIDVCALPENAKCDTYFTPEMNGLSQDWNNTCWMNPPYDKKEQPKWVEKAYNESVKNNSTIVCLIPARVDNKIWHNIVFPNASNICFIKGRLKFGNSKNSAPFPSALITFGNVTNEQVRLLSQLGYMVNIIPTDRIVIHYNYDYRNVINYF